MFPLAYKSTAAVAFALQKGQTATALPTLCYSSRVAFVSVVSAFRVHFLTFIDNYPIIQRSSSHACNLFGRAVRGVRFRCIFAVTCIWVQSYKLVTNKPNIFAKKLC